MTTCGTCGATIVWGNWARSQRRVPIDVEPNENGKLVIVSMAPDGSPQVELAHVMEQLREQPPAPANISLFDEAAPGELFDAPPPLPPERYTTHFVTCSNWPPKIGNGG